MFLANLRYFAADNQHESADEAATFMGLVVNTIP